MAAGMTPRYAGSAPVLPPLPRSVAPTPAPAVAAPTPVQTQSEAADISSLTRVAEITRKLYQQSNANAVLSTAVNEIGSQWKVTRCIAAMRKPGLPPTMVHEYCADPIGAGDPASLTTLLALLQDLAVSRSALTIVDAPAAPELRGVRELVAGLSIASLLALPLSDGVDPVGVDRSVSPPDHRERDTGISQHGDPGIVHPDLHQKHTVEQTLSHQGAERRERVGCRGP